MVKIIRIFLFVISALKKQNNTNAPKTIVFWDHYENPLYFRNNVKQLLKSEFA